MNTHLVMAGSNPRTYRASFTIIKNVAAPISGIFFNLSEGSQLVLGANRFRISYVGGDGSDLTLTNAIPKLGSICLTAFGVLLISLRSSRRLRQRQ